MDLNTLRDSENVIIGFSLMSGCHVDEDFFIRNLPANLTKGKVLISIIPEGISIASGLDGTRSFKISPGELSIFKAYVESDETRIEIEHPGGYDLRAHVIFINEPTREASIKG